MKDLKNMNSAALFGEYQKTQSELTRLKLDCGFKKLKDYSKISKARKRIARILTILNLSLDEANEK